MNDEKPEAGQVRLLTREQLIAALSKYRTANAALEADAARMREALEEIEHKATHDWQPERGSWTRQQWAADIARATLNAIALTQDAT